MLVSFSVTEVVSVGLTAVKQCKMDCVILTDTGSLGISMWRGLACAAIVPVRAKCFPHSGRVKIPLLPPPIFSPLTPILDGQKAESPWLVQECLISSTLPRLGGIKKLKLEDSSETDVPHSVINYACILTILKFRTFLKQNFCYCVKVLTCHMTTSLSKFFANWQIFLFSFVKLYRILSGGLGHEHCKTGNFWPWTLKIWLMIMSG